MAVESIGCTQDGSLIRKAQGGDRAAFAQLMLTYDQAVLQLALRLTGAEHDAHEIYRESFLKVYKKLDRFRFEFAFATWIYRIVTEVCLDHLRRSRARKESGAREVNDGERLNRLSDEGPGNNPGQRLPDQELSTQILRALKRLTPRERMVFDLKHFQGLKLQSVSDILNTSEASVKMTFFRATRKLRFHLCSNAEWRRSSMKHCCDKGGKQWQKAKRLAVTTISAATVNQPMSEPPPWIEL
jgi:RNA polymerase sigma-70 factor (ECF subfamily)